MKLFSAAVITAVSLVVGGCGPSPVPSPPSPTTIVSTPSPSYKYFGTQIGKSKYVVRLDSATLSTGHVAVWGGVQNAHATRWVQAGIEDQDSTGPHLYIEVRNGSWSRYSIRYWPAKFGQRAVVRLIHVGNRWYVTVSGKRSKALYFSRPIKLGTLEVMSKATGIAHLNGRLVRSS